MLCRSTFLSSILTQEEALPGIFVHTSAFPLGQIEVISLTNLLGALLQWRVSRAFCACGIIFLSVVIGLFDFRFGFYVLWLAKHVTFFSFETQFFARVKKQYLHGMKETRISGILTSFWTSNVSVRFAFVVTDSLPPPVPAPRQTSFVQGLYSIRFHFYSGKCRFFVGIRTWSK